MSDAPEQITVCDGKYTLVMDPGNLRALRYGEPWRDLVGDGFVMALGHEILDLRADAACLLAAIEALNFKGRPLTALDSKLNAAAARIKARLTRQ